jgi:hypothetical protein
VLRFVGRNKLPPLRPSPSSCRFQHLHRHPGQTHAAERDTAALEREKSQQVASFLTGLFRLADPTRTKGGSITLAKSSTAAPTASRANLAPARNSGNHDERDRLVSQPLLYDPVKPSRKGSPSAAAYWPQHTDSLLVC